jgi:hypothetical protein
MKKTANSRFAHLISTAKAVVFGCQAGSAWAQGDLVRPARRAMIAAMLGCIIGTAAAGDGGSKPPPVEIKGVHFTSRAAKSAVEPGVQVVVLSYEFTNTSDSPVAVEEFIQSCGCMSGEWDGKPVAPGATGTIKAKLVTTGLRGLVRKSLRVKFLELGTVELMGEVTIPEALTYSAQTLHWKIGAASSSQDVEITVNSKIPVHVRSVDNNDPSFASTLVTIEEGRRYKITITPRDTTTARVGVFQVRTDAIDPRDAVHGLFALVEAPTVAAESSPKGGQP